MGVGAADGGAALDAPTCAHAARLRSAPFVLLALAPSCALADACATALGNRVKTRDDIGAALDWLSGVEGVTGGLVVMGDALGAWGNVELLGPG